MIGITILLLISLLLFVAAPTALLPDLTQCTPTRLSADVIEYNCPAIASAQGSTSVFVAGPDGVTKPMELKDEDLQLTKDNVVTIPLNGKISIFADVGVQLTSATLTPAANPQIDLPIVGGQISFDGLYSGLYTLDVSIGDTIYECIVVVEPEAEDEQPEQ